MDAAGHVLQRLLQQRTVATLPLRATQHRLMAKNVRAQGHADAMAGLSGRHPTCGLHSKGGLVLDRRCWQIW